MRAIYEDSGLVGGVVVPADLWMRHVTQPTYRTVFVNATDGTTMAELRSAITPVAQRFGGDVQDRTEYIEAAGNGLDMLLGIVYVLLALAIVIALLGIGNTLSLSVHERRREIGLLRAVGQTRRQTRTVLRLESMVVSSFGTGLGLVLGSFLGWMMVIAVTSDGSVAVPVVSARDRRGARSVGRAARRRTPRAPSRTSPDPRCDRRAMTTAFHLARTPRKVVLLAHVLASVGWFGVAVAIAAAGITAAATGDATLPPLLYRVMADAVWLTIPMGLLALTTGTILGLGTKWGVVQHWWVVVKVAITTAVLVTDPLVVARAANRALDSGSAPRPLYGSTIAHCVMLTIATALSMLKPGGRTPWARH